MFRFLLTAFIVHGLLSVTTLADEFLVRVDTVGYVDKLASDKDTQETTLFSIESIVRPQSTFRSKVTLGLRTLTLTGKLEPGENGEFKLQIRYRDVTDTQETVLTKPGQREPVLHTRQVSTNLTLTLDTPVTLGGLESKTKESGQPAKTSKTSYVVTLTKYDPAAE